MGGSDPHLDIRGVERLRGWRIRPVLLVFAVCSQHEFPIRRPCLFLRSDLKEHLQQACPKLIPVQSTLASWAVQASVREKVVEGINAGPFSAISAHGRLECGKERHE